MLVERAAQAGPDGQLFPKVSDGSLLKYVHTQDGGDFKTKDFRTALANRIASREVAAHSAPIDEKTYRKSIMDVAKIVSEQLGNTAVIALESYIDPSVFADWRMGSGL
jgi:DNA topoisomerase IB